ncbi:MAG: phosphoribosyltransferase family protein [Gammaproteobacteria bacterium]|nr:phosphoribosyltransferase family protein [Gammaproteobacteria bacterium]
MPSQGLTPAQFNVVHKASKILISKQEIDNVEKHMAVDIAAVFKGEPLTVMPVLKGGMSFGTHMMEHLDALECPHSMDYVHATRYANGLRGSKKVQWPRGKPDPKDIEGKNILLVEDLLEGGDTLQEIVNTLQAMNPKRIEVAVLFSKKDTRSENGLKEATYTGIKLEGKAFVYGRGLDLKQYGRGFGDLYEVNQEVLKQVLAAGRLVSFWRNRPPITEKTGAAKDTMGNSCN